MQLACDKICVENTGSKSYIYIDVNNGKFCLYITIIQIMLVWNKIIIKGYENYNGYSWVMSACVKI